MNEIELAYVGIEVPEPASLDAVLRRRHRPRARRRPRTRGATTARRSASSCRRGAPTTPRSSASRRRTAPRSTRTVARLHAAGFETADGDAADVTARKVQRLARTTAPWGIAGRDRARPRRRADAVLVAARARRLPHRRRRLRPRRVRHARPSTSRTAFLTDGLGLAQSDWLEMEIAPGIELEVRFYHCNARHHTVALAKAPFELPQTLHHLMFETNERDDVGAAFDRAWATDLGHPERARPPRQRRDVQLLRAEPGRLPGRGRPRRQGRHRRLGRQPPLRPHQRVGPPAPAPRRDGRRRRRDRRLRPGRQRAGDPARPARALGRRARAVARAVPAAARGALRPRGRAHPPVVRHRRRAPRDQRAGRGLRVAQRRRHDAAALRPRRATARRAGRRRRCSTSPRSSGCSTNVPATLGVDVRRGVEVTGVDQRDDHVVVSGADGTIAVGALRRRLRRRQQHRAHAARRCRSPTSGSSTTGSSST